MAGSPAVISQTSLVTPVSTPSSLSTMTPSIPPLPTPVFIDWHYWQQRRPLVLELNNDVPPYLMLPEVHQVLEAAKDLELHFLLQTLWHSGARISEALMLTRESFTLDHLRNSYVILSSLKKKRGHPIKNEKAAAPKRLIPIVDPAYIEAVKRFVATTNPRKGQPLFTLDRFQVDYRLKALQKQLHLPVASLSAHTFRHSFAVNALVQGRDIKTIQTWLGHKNIANTEVYLKVLSGETYHLMYGMQF